MSRFCRILFILLAVAYGGALAIFVVGTFGFFRAEPDPLSGIFLVALGWPWNRLIDLFPAAVWPALAVTAPAINLGLIAAICQWRRH